MLRQVETSRPENRLMIVFGIACGLRMLVLRYPRTVRNAPVALSQSGMKGTIKQHDLPWPILRRAI